MVNEWVAWAWVVAVDLAIVAAVAASFSDGTRLPALVPKHAAGATIVGLAGWDSVSAAFGSLTDHPPGSAADLALLFAQATFAAAAAVAVVAILARRRWAIVLALGLAVARIALTVVGAADLLSIGADLDAATLRSTLIFIGLSGVPYVAAAWLLLDPFVRGQLPWARQPASG